LHHTPKHIKRLVREWSAVAHERDLRLALSELRSQFDLWERGQITSYDLDGVVHRYHDGAAREIWKRYPADHLEPAVASAVVAGILRREELPPELLRHLAALIDFYQADQK
jgi:hypothetical protein